MCWGVARTDGRPPEPPAVQRLRTVHAITTWLRAGPDVVPQVIHIEDQGRAFSPYRSAYRSDREMDIAAMYRAARDHRRDRARLRARMVPRRERPL